jgi:hypothetical protein
LKWSANGKFLFAAGDTKLTVVTRNASKETIFETI